MSVVRYNYNGREKYVVYLIESCAREGGRACEHSSFLASVSAAVMVFERPHVQSKGREGRCVSRLVRGL